MALITVDELRDRIDDDGLRVVDVRFHLADPDRGRRSYDESHLPGAVFVDLHTELAAAGGAGEADAQGDAQGEGVDAGGGRHPLPAVAAFTTLLGTLGIERDTFVVAYDDLGGAIAARLWWMLRSIGHARVAVLDGGIQAWNAAGLATTDVVPTPTATAYPDTTGWTGVVTADEVAEEVAAGGVVADARSADRYRGDHEPIDPRAGHIPGAVNHFHGDLLDASGHHRPTGDLARSLAPLGDAPIVYCGSGVTACHLLLGLAEAGVSGARLYPGSWSEWSSDPARPIATGP